MYQDREQVASGEWISGTIPWNVNGLPLGTYQFKLVVWDETRNRALDTVLVKVFPTGAPELSTPEDITYEEGVTGQIITWTAGDRHPETYVIYINSVQVATGTWSNGTITWKGDELTQGTYNMTLMVQDAAWNRVSDTVWITVTPPTPTVTVVSPMGGEQWSGVQNITWTASSFQADLLTYAVSYSYDGGQTWIQLTTGLTDPFYLWDTTVVNGINYRIRVEASDGMHTVVDITDTPFEIANTPPPLNTTSISSVTSTITNTETSSDAFFVPSFRVIEALGAIVVLLSLGKRQRRQHRSVEE